MMNGGLPTGSLIPPNGDPADVQFYQNERFSTESRIAAAPSASAHTIPITIPFVFDFRPENVRAVSIRERLRERMVLVANSYPDKALQITGASFSARSNFWAPVLINFVFVTQMPGADKPEERVLRKTTAVKDRMVTAAIQPGAEVLSKVFSVPDAEIVRPLATRAPVKSGRGIQGMLSAEYPDYNPKILGVVCRKVPKNSHLGIYLSEEAARQPTPDEAKAFLSKSCAEVTGEFYAMYSSQFGVKFAEMVARERNRMFLDDVTSGTIDFEIIVMPQVFPIGGEVVDLQTITAQNPLISNSLMNPSSPNEEVIDRWNNQYMVAVECVFYFAAHPRE